MTADHNAASTSHAAVIETHISVVFFVGDRAYKALKPIDSAFLDNSTQPNRLANVRAEVDLNRRMAPDVYLGILDVVRDGATVDHIIEMRRMPADRRLSALLGTDEALGQLRQVARTVAAFHAAQPPSDRAAHYGSLEQVAQRWQQNLAEMTELGSPWLPPDDLEKVGDLSRRYLAHRKPLFVQRIADGYVRDGHGDLLADDIFCLDDGPRILDCLAFDESLRIGDVLADIAFLVMDVERLGGSQAARQLLGWYQEFGGEHHPSSLAHHYVAYRALVRAKVEAIRAAQGGDSGAQAAVHLAQTLDHLHRSQVRLVVVGGSPGTGKSTLAAAIGVELGAVVEHSDELRKDLAGLGHTQRTSNPLDGGLYDPSWTRRTYEELVARAGHLLAFGESVVLDGRWSEEWQRVLARDVAHRTGAGLIELECRLPLDVAQQRVKARFEADHDASDAGPEVVERLTARQAPWPQALPCDTTLPIRDLLNDLIPHVLDDDG